MNRSIIPNTIYNGKYIDMLTMNTKIMSFAISLIIAVSVITTINNVSATELNTNDFEFTIHITDVIPFYTWNGISKVLTDSERSFEDIDTIRLIIENSNYYAVYNNNVSDNTFEFAGIYENGA